MLKIFGFLAISILAASFAQAVGFSKGNNFTTRTIQGQVFVSCEDNFGRRYTQLTRCAGEFLDPVETDYFVGPAGIDADEVMLTATAQDGEVETKSSSYDVKAGKSSKKFNLWIATLLQTPLLGMGQNKIQYSFSKQGQAVSSGEFIAIVTVGKTYTCPQGSLWDSAGGDMLCRNPNFACQRYFQQYNYCQ